MSDDTDKLDEFHKQLRAIFAELGDDIQNEVDVVAAFLTAELCAELFTEKGVEGGIKWAMENPEEFHEMMEDTVRNMSATVILVTSEKLPGEEITGD